MGAFGIQVFRQLGRRSGQLAVGGDGAGELTATLDAANEPELDGMAEDAAPVGEAAVTGQMVVPMEIVDVTTMGVWLSAGQLVIVGAQLVIVKTEVVKIVETVEEAFV